MLLNSVHVLDKLYYTSTNLLYNINLNILKSY